MKDKKIIAPNTSKLLSIIKNDFGWTQEELADMAKIKRPNMARKLSGEHNMNLENCIYLIHQLKKRLPAKVYHLLIHKLFISNERFD